MAKKKKLTKAERKEARTPPKRQAVAAHLYRITEKDEPELPGTLSCGCCDCH